MLFFRDDRGQIKKPTATYWGARLLTQEWVQPGARSHQIYPAFSDVRNGNGDQVVTAYAVHRPDGLWALMLINRDPNRVFQTTLNFLDTSSGSLKGFQGSLDLYQYSSQQYVLGGLPQNPYPVKVDEPAHRIIQSEKGTRISLPAYSLTIVRGAVPGLEAETGN